MWGQDYFGTSQLHVLEQRLTQNEEQVRLVEQELSDHVGAFGTYVSSNDGRVNMLETQIHNGVSNVNIRVNELEARVNAYHPTPLNE